MLRSWLKKNMNVNDVHSISYRCRKKRMQIFTSFYEERFPPPPRDKVSILDVGGTLSYWSSMKFQYASNVSITLLNLNEQNISPEFGIYESILGDATDLSQFEDKRFDLVFSNSVIEHVGDFTQQEKMANEIMRVGKSYFIQTPNRYFPVDPHYCFPFFQYFPEWLQIFIMKHLRLGWFHKAKNTADALNMIYSVRLMNKAELLALFPDAELYREKIGPLTKSFLLFSAASPQGLETP